MILVDSSIWIDYFKKGEASFDLSEFIDKDLVLTNEITLSELIPQIIHRQEYDLAASLKALECRKHIIFWEGIRSLQQLNLKMGLNKVGIPDLIIAQQCMMENLTLWSLDRHFYHMSQFTNLKLY